MEMLIASLIILVIFDIPLGLLVGHLAYKLKPAKETDTEFVQWFMILTGVLFVFGLIFGLKMGILIGYLLYTIYIIETKIAKEVK